MKLQRDPFKYATPLFRLVFFFFPENQRKDVESEKGKAKSKNARDPNIQCGRNKCPNVLRIYAVCTLALFNHHLFISCQGPTQNWFAPSVKPVEDTSHFSLLFHFPCFFFFLHLP